jgi:spore coat protein SA
MPPEPRVCGRNSVPKNDMGRNRRTVPVPTTTYHLLAEVEPFSEFYGGAISRWAGNVLRGDADSVVVCPSADHTWNFPRESVLALSNLERYKRFRRYRSKLWPLHHVLIRRIFRPVLERVRPRDIVWIHNRPEYAVALTRDVHRAGGRVVLHLQNSHLVQGPERLMRRIRVDKMIFISEFLLEEARRKFPMLGSSSVLYSGADETIFYPAEEGRETSGIPTVLFVGRLVRDKGVHVLVDAMKLLEEQGVRLQAQIVGSSGFGGSEETDYIRRLKASSPPTINFLPYRSGAALGDLFRQADIFCSPSVWEEPFGLVNVEALASGLPVVSTRSGGVTEILSSGGGILVEPGSASDLAAALRRLAEDPELRTRLSRQAHCVFRERFTWSIARRQFKQVQNELSA